VVNPIIHSGKGCPSLPPSARFVISAMFDWRVQRTLTLHSTRTSKCVNILKKLLTKSYTHM